MKRPVEGSESRRLSLGTYTKLMRATESVNQRIERLCPLREKLTISQFAVLEALHFHGPMKQVEIARKILKTPGNLTTVIDHLVRDGLVDRIPSALDRRANTIGLTSTGEDLITLIFPQVADAIETVFSVLDAQELSDVSRLLKKLGTSSHKQVITQI